MDSRAGVERTSGIADAAGGHGPVLTVREAALRAGVNERTVRRAITDNDTAALVGMLRGRLEVVESERDRLLAITAGEITREDAPQEDDPRPVRDAASVRASETPQDAQGSAWCRWGRRMTGGAVGLS
jgi:hypothetical protein